MAPKKPAKLGEGTRVRKESKYGKDGRAVGGEARRAELKKKGALPQALQARMAKDVEKPPVPNGIVPPGGHPPDLIAAAASKGHAMPGGSMGTNAFERLQGLKAKAPPPGKKVEKKALEEPEIVEQVADDSLEDLFKISSAEQRPSRTREEAAEILEKAKRRLPILSVAEETKIPDQPAWEIEFWKEADLWAAEIKGNGISVEAKGESKDEARQRVKEEAAKAWTALHTPETGLALISTEQTRAGSIAQRKAVTTYSPRQQEEVAAIMSLPGVICNNCPAAEVCPSKKQDSTCAFDDDINAMTARDGGNLIPFLEVVADLQKRRALRAVLIENMTAGGQLDPGVTKQLQIATDAMKELHNIKNPAVTPQQPSIRITAEVGGTPEQQASGGGFLAGLMAAVAKKPAAPQIVDPIDTASPLLTANTHFDNVGFTDEAATSLEIPKERKSVEESKAVEQGSTERGVHGEGSVRGDTLGGEGVDAEDRRDPPSVP